MILCDAADLAVPPDAFQTRKDRFAEFSYLCCCESFFSFLFSKSLSSVCFRSPIGGSLSLWAPFRSTEPCVLYAP